MQLGLRLTEALQRARLRQSLQRELAALQRGLPSLLLTYERLLAFCVRLKHTAAAMLADLAKKGQAPASNGSPADPYWRQAHAQAAADAELLAALHPDSPGDLFVAMVIEMPVLDLSSSARLPALRRLQRARELAVAQGSNFWQALCSYQLLLGTCTVAMSLACCTTAPATVLQWVAEADAALRRCKRQLPKQWTTQSMLSKQDLHALKDMLRVLSITGSYGADGLWRPGPLTPDQFGQLMQLGVEAASLQQANGGARPLSTCDACGRFSCELRHCGACRSKAYCRQAVWRRRWQGAGRRCAWPCQPVAPLPVPPAAHTALSASASTGAAGTSRSARRWRRRARQRHGRRQGRQRRGAEAAHPLLHSAQPPCACVH